MNESTVEQFLAGGNYTYDPEIAEKAENGSINKKDCSVVVRYSLGHTYKQPSSELKRMPDNEIRYSFQ